MSTTTIWADDRGREARATIAADGTYHVAPDALAHLMGRAGFHKVSTITPANGDLILPDAPTEVTGL